MSEWYDEFKTETRRRLAEKLIATFEALQRQTTTAATTAATVDGGAGGGEGRGGIKAKGLDEAYVYDAFPYDLTTGEQKKHHHQQQATTNRQATTSRQATSDRQVQHKYKPAKKMLSTGSSDDYMDVITQQLFDIINEQEQRISELERKLLNKRED